MKSSFIILSIILFTSCKMNPGVSSSDTKKKTDIGSMQPDAERVFSKSEMDIIQSTCSNLIFKRNYYNSLDDMKNVFGFSVEASNCLNDVIMKYAFNTLLTNSNSTDLEYYADRTDYLKNVITDQSAGIKYLCDNVGAINLRNTFTEYNNKYSFKVFINQGFNHIEIIKFVKESSGTWRIKSADAIDFVKDLYQGKKENLGMEQEHLRNLYCENGKQYYIKQTWVK